MTLPHSRDNLGARDGYRTRDGYRMTVRRARHKLTFLCKYISDIVLLLDFLGRAFPRSETTVSAKFQVILEEVGSVDDDEQLISLEVEIQDDKFDMDNNNLQEKVRVLIEQLYRTTSNINYKSIKTTLLQEHVLDSVYRKRWVRCD